ncbi:MAG: PHP domain-containing protein [Anaerolineales bacterium]|nr:PHP domain-containing protein [Anaerolineales bacterium]
MGSLSKIDLHIHSSISLDGEYSPEVLVARAKSRSVELMAVADHNSTRGVGAAVAAGRPKYVAVVPAIELDCIYKGIDLHLLGYGIDYNDPAYAILEGDIDRKVHAIFSETLEKLARNGITVDPDRVLAASGGKPPCGELIAEVLLGYDDTRRNPVLAPYLPGGERGDMPHINFYRDFCAQGKPAYVPIPFMSLEEAVTLVKRTGGTPVIAHPAVNLHADFDMVDQLLHIGVEGIEVYTSYHSPEQTAFFRDKALRHKVRMTCGSDFHGKNKPLIQIGDCASGGDEERIIDQMQSYAA